MTIEQQVADLTTATTRLLDAVNVGKQTLDSRVDSTAANAASAAASAAIANTKAGEASGSAANALAIYGTTSAQQAALINAQAAASLAQGHAASASSVVQQDLSGVTAAALHRSPNAVTAMFVYDTSKDSDGGAWTERCEHTSWFNEALTGKWLGAFNRELHARYAGATVAPTELITNGTFDTDISGWTPVYLNGTSSWEDGKLKLTTLNGSQWMGVGRSFTTVVGKQYRVRGLLSGVNAANIVVHIGTSLGNNNVRSGGQGELLIGDIIFTATTTTTFIGVQLGLGTFVAYVDDISVREVTALNTSSNDYFQLTTDGKFYRLNPTSGVTEVFRGNKRKFPKLAGIVAEAASVTIYDLTEPGRPMWMRWVHGGFNSMLGNNNAGKSIACLNGKVLIGDAQYDLYDTNFATDSTYRYSLNTITGPYKGNIASRNSQMGWIQTGTLNIAARAVNAVAMTVLPDAPVDPVTGLKVPTIAVATAGGVSVIKHNGTVVNSSHTASFRHVSIVPKNHELLGVWAGGESSFMFGCVGNLNASFPVLKALNSLSANPINTRGAVQKKLEPVGVYQFLSINDHSDKGVTVLRQNGHGTRGTSAYVTSAFNTGHMVGDIRRAYLADIGAGSAPSNPTLINGDFNTSDVSQWGAQDANISRTVVSGELVVNLNAGGGSTYVYLVIGTVPGYRYTIESDIRLGTGISFVRNEGRDGGAGTGAGLGVSGNMTSNGRLVFTFTAISGITSIRFWGEPSARPATFYIDNVLIKNIAEPDRSYKAQGADITGTLTKSQVASAAQLVAYSGFSAANYLREPYSADLDFGTGEWSVGAWVNVPAVLPLAGFPIVGSNLYTNQIAIKQDANGSVSSYDNATKTLSVTNTGNPGNGYPCLGFNLGMLASKAYEIELQLSGTNANLTQIRVMAGWSNPVSLVIDSNGYAKFMVVPTIQSSNTLYLMVGGIGAAPLSVTLVSLSVRELGTAVLADRAHSSGPKVNLGVDGGGRLTATAFDGTTTRTVTTTAAYNTATWLKAEATYTTDGALAIRVNGVEVAKTTGAPLLTLSNSNAVLTIGNSYALDAPFPGSLALLKLSATVPTAEQSVWMYEQEKQMFRDGAQVTLPDAGSIVDLAYDDLTDKWIAVSAVNESEWSGLVRTSVTPSPAGSYTKATATSGVQLLARNTTNPGVDITMPAYGLREELVKRAEAAARLSQTIVPFEFDATAGQTDFVLPVGYTAHEVISAGANKREGTTKDWVRLFDGFKETIRFAVSPGAATWIRINAKKE